MRKRDIIITAAILYIGKGILDDIGYMLDCMARRAKPFIIEKAKEEDEAAVYICDMLKWDYQKTTAKQQIGFHV